MGKHTIGWGKGVGLSLGLLLAVLIGQSPIPAEPADFTPISPVPPPAIQSLTPEPPMLNELATIQNQFGFDLLAQLHQNPGAENVIISPVSVAMALLMAQNGAAGDTRTAMAQTLGVADLTPAQVNQAIAAQLTALATADPEVQLTLANSLWVRDGIPLEPAFVTTAETTYQAQVTTLDFSQPSALAAINGWVNHQTQGLIPTIISQIQPQDLLFLVNAVYFKGNWQQPFDPDQTQPQPFYRADGSARPYPLMQRSGQFLYGEVAGWQVVQLPYGRQQLGMVVALPPADQSLADPPRLNSQTWQGWQAGLRSQPGRVELPKFKLEFGTDLVPTLTALGMGPAFDAKQANFQALSPVPTVISQVVHKTVVEVNETGTEAAAATAIGMTATSAPIQPPPPFEMVVNRPFFMAIQDYHSGTILFMGWVTNPALD